MSNHKDQKESPQNLFFVILIMFFLTGFFFNSQCLAVTVSSDTLTALFIGNSLTGFNQMPNTVQNLGLAAGKEIYCDGKIIFGTSIVEICNRSDTKERILERNWDYVVIQGDIHLTAFPENHHIIMPWVEYDPIEPMLYEMKEFISQNLPAAKMIFFMPWAYEDGMTWIAGQTDTYETMQQKIYENSLRFAENIGFVVAPVGWAWNKVWHDSPQIDLFDDDYVHPEPTGSYLAACVFYCVFFLESIEDNSYTAAGLSSSDAIYFQQVASTIVMDNLELWHLVNASNISDENSAPAKFQLYQNFPNPFNPSTNISFELASGSYITLKIYDILGNEIITLLDKELNAGYHNITFDAGLYIYSLPSGTYFYRLRHKHGILTNKMTILK